MSRQSKISNPNSFGGVGPSGTAPGSYEPPTRGEDEIIRVLLIEDNPGDAYLIQRELARSKVALVDVECAERLSTGLERLAAGGIDVILLDLGLPDSRGLDTFTKIHAQAPGVPIVVLTAIDDEALALRAVRQGAQDYLTKGQVDSNLLVRAIRYAIERKRAGEELKRSFESLRKAMEGTIHAMAVTVEKRDPYTSGHQRRVANLAHAIAKEMRFPHEQIDGIHMAAYVHDIGKIYIPAEILSKPGRLTEIEFIMIKTHPQVGYDILKKIEFPWPIAQIVLQHHKRVDGSGYPEGLLDEDILVEARILGIADVIEAMSSHRPYRPALGIDKALGEISKNRGILYDTQVTDACLKLFSKRRFKFE
ncbi:MAG: HD domain-containing protein [Syntrophobacterales bacterium]|nr:MAG: HD domain-containing protein [Syntrophobacterales bacterium]